MFENFRQIKLDFTEWKFHEFSINQTLREIIIGESRRSKTAIFAHFRALNYGFRVNHSLQKMQKISKVNIQSL